MTTPPTVASEATTPSPETSPKPAKPSWIRRILGVLLVVVVTLLVLGLILFGVMFWFWQQGAQMVSTVYGGPLPRSVMPIMGIEDDAHRHRLAVVVVPDQKLMLLMVQAVPSASAKPAPKTEPAPTNVNTQEFATLLSQWSNDATMDPTIAMYLKQAQASTGIQQIKLPHTTLPAISLSSLSMEVGAASTPATSEAMDSLITILPASGVYPETLVLGLNPQGKMTPEQMSLLLAPMPRFADAIPSSPAVK